MTTSMSEPKSKQVRWSDDENDPWMKARRFWLTLTVLAILLGTIFRAGQYLSRQSIRADEAGLLLKH